MTTHRYHPDGTTPEPHQVFVFGSNLSGLHGGGAARAAFDHYGAAWGVGEGRTGNSYALPTVAKNVAGPLPLTAIAVSVGLFIAYAGNNPDTEFFVTRVGCGLAGHRDEDIAPMFKNAPANCILPEPWRNHLEGAP